MMLKRLLLLSIVLLALWPQSLAQEDCSTAPSPRLRIGISAQTSSGQSNNVRDAADTDAERLGQIPPDSQFIVLSDATCADGYYWYQVDYQGLVGWTVEGAEGEYWLIPVLSNTQIMTPENISQLQVINQFTCPELELAYALAWSPDGTHLLWACRSSGIYLTDWLSQETKNFPMAENLRSSSIKLAAFYADGTRFFQYLYPTATFFEISTGQVIDSYTPSDGVSASFAIAAHGNTLATAGEFGIHLIDLLSLEEIATLSREESSLVYSLTFSPDGERLAFSGDGDAISVWTIATGEILRIPLAASHIQRLRFSPSGLYILAAVCLVPNRGDCNEAALQWIDATSGEITSTWQESDWNEIIHIHFGQDLVFIRANGHFEILQISTDERLYSSNEQYSFGDILPSVDGRLLVAAKENRLEIYGIP